MRTEMRTEMGAPREGSSHSHALMTGYTRKDRLSFEAKKNYPLR
jgi:hypothetical protein